MVRTMTEGIVNRFLRSAKAEMLQKNETEIRCPCRRCKLKSLIADPDSGQVRDHLLLRGFMDGYRWQGDEDDYEVVHGGRARNEEGQQDNHRGSGGREDEESPGDDHDGDAVHSHHVEDAGHDDDAGGADDAGPSMGWVQDPHIQELLLKQTDNARAAAREKAKLDQLEIDAVTPLYEGCRPEDTRLKVTLMALEMKVKHKMTDACFDENMSFWHERLPKGNKCPTSFEEAKKIVCPLDLPHVKYHVCMNNCIIYRDEHAESTICPVCGVTRYKKRKKAPRKVVWYFPITPRLQRYFADPKVAKLLRWHADREEKKREDDANDPEIDKKDKMLSHPKDASQWQALNFEDLEFGNDPRNIVLGASTDGVNPFGSQRSTHSTWPVFVWMYNLPPWLCMKRKYIHMSMLIEGPKQPGNDINPYLGLLKEELDTLWKTPANTWDAAEKEYFPMRAALLTTVHDYLGYGYLAGQVVHGFSGCVRCMDDTTYRQLDRDPGSSKTVFMGHRRWLRDDDPWRKRKDLFDGETEPRKRPCTRSGEEIDKLLKNWKDCPLPGKKQKAPEPGKKRKAPEPLLKVWKTRSVFWDLPYWKIHRVPHSLDVMHITKNVCESLLGTLLNMPERTKDGPKARADLKSMGIREELHANDDDDDEAKQDTESRRKGKKAKKTGNDYPPACFTLSQEEIEQFFTCLLGVKLPYGYAGKISRYLDPAKQKFSGMKSHDCHVLMTQILPVAIRGIMDAHVRETLFGLCNFFDVISRKSIGVRQLRRLQEEIVVILCELEMYFPPAFFDVMVHLLVHIVEDIIQLGPTFLHSMMPFERMNGVIKGYVRNMSRPEGSIARGFLTEECISYCTNYLGIENPVGLPVNRHLGRLAGWGHREGRREMHVDFEGRLADFERANLVALQHIDVVDPWVVEHKTFIEKTYNDRGQQRTDGDILKEHNSCFTRWFKQKLLSYPLHEDSSAEEQLIFALSQGAEHNLMTYEAYDINGYTFYTEDKDMKSDGYQNSGVTMESYTGNDKDRYYGRIEEIWELSYAGEKVPMFRVRWAKSVLKEDRYFTTMVIPEAKSKTAGANVTAKNEPWVLASQVDQCFFITDPSKPSRVVVRRGKRKIIGMDGVANEQDFDKYGDPRIEHDDDDEVAAYTTRRSRTTLPKGRPFHRRTPFAKKKGKKIVNR